MPGLVSTLLNQAYSTPGRLVQTFLQVTEQVWQPMHLSRFSTMPICARIFIVFVLSTCVHVFFEGCAWHLETAGFAEYRSHIGDSKQGPPRSEAVVPLPRSERGGRRVATQGVFTSSSRDRKSTRLN